MLRHIPATWRVCAAGLEAAAAAGGVYRPPKLNPVAMEEDRALSNKERRRLLEAQRRAKRRYVVACGIKSM
jgi:hypothetical protein